MMESQPTLPLHRNMNPDSHISHNCRFKDFNRKIMINHQLIMMINHHIKFHQISSVLKLHEFSMVPFINFIKLHQTIFKQQPLSFTSVSQHLLRGGQVLEHRLEAFDGFGDEGLFSYSNIFQHCFSSWYWQCWPWTNRLLPALFHFLPIMPALSLSLFVNHDFTSISGRIPGICLNHLEAVLSFFP